MNWWTFAFQLLESSMKWLSYFRKYIYMHTHIYIMCVLPIYVHIYNDCALTVRALKSLVKTNGKNKGAEGNVLLMFLPLTVNGCVDKIYIYLRVYIYIYIFYFWYNNEKKLCGYQVAQLYKIICNMYYMYLHVYLSIYTCAYTDT